MKTFYISVAIFIALVAWLLNKPIPKQAQVARAFTDAEVIYIDKSFDYAMDNLKEGEHADWSTAGVNGRISVGQLFKSKLKADCRNYVEIARTYDAQKTESGVACKRHDEEGWCRLPTKVPQSCALEVTESSITKRTRYAIMQGSQMIDRALGTSVNVSNDHLAPPVPTVPSIGGLPEVHAPDISTDVHLPAPWEWDKK